MQSSKEQQEEIRKPSSRSIQRNRGKQNEKHQRSLKENQRYQGNISCKDGLNKGQKQQGPKGNGKKEKYSHLNAKFERITRRDKKDFLSDQCKIEENNRMGKTRSLFKKIRDTKGKISCKDGHNKGKNDMDITEAEDIKKRWQEYTELYKKDLHDPDNHDGMITHLEPDVLECKVKWAQEASL